MNPLEQPSKPARRWALALTAAGAAAAIASPAAQAAPPFQMPVPCGQTWEASTYEGHWNGDQDAIDLAQRDDDGVNISEGEPALASAAGTVEERYTSNGEHRVLLDHGGGWKTHYVHLEQVPPLAVGQRVAQGEQIGRISNSGADSMHLHYNHEKYPAPDPDFPLVPIEFNGELIDTNAENEDSWGTWGNGEKLTSLNCPGNSFMQFTQDGKRHQLEYKPGTGAVSIDRFKADAKGLDHRWSGTWSRGWTHITPFSKDGQPRFFAYKSSTGKVSFNKINANGQGNTSVSSGTWGKGWTHFMPFSKGGNSHYVAYNSLYGHANLDRINAAGKGWENDYDVVFPHLDTPPVILTPLPGRRWRIYLRPTSDTSDLVAEAGEVIRRYQPGARFDDIENPTRFRCHSRVATRFRSGRVLLAGDAAHACTPAEGHGMNTGLQDAFNLGWKLALVCRGEAGAGLLDSYEAERRPVAERVVSSGAEVESAHAMTEAGERAARDAEIRRTFADPDTAHHEAAAAAEIDRLYPRSRAVAGDDGPDPGPGARLPETEHVEPVDGDPRSLHELTHRRGHTLIVLGGPQADPGRVSKLVADLGERSDAAVDAVVGLCTRPGGPQVGRIDESVAVQLGGRRRDGARYPSGPLHRLA